MLDPESGSLNRQGAEDAKENAERRPTGIRPLGDVVSAINQLNRQVLLAPSRFKRAFHGVGNHVKSLRSMSVWLVTAAQLLTACATSDDPRQGGFVSGVVGLTTGTYQARIDEREEIYRTELSNQQRLQAEAERIRRERTAIQAELRESERRLSDLERSIRAQRRALERDGRSSPAAEQERRQLQAAEQRLSSTRERLAEARTDAAPLSDARIQSRNIKSELDDLDAFVALLGSKQF